MLWTFENVLSIFTGCADTGLYDISFIFCEILLITSIKERFLKYELLLTAKCFLICSF